MADQADGQRNGLGRPETVPLRKYLIGDAFDLIGQVPSHSLNLIITSPPYWGQRTYGAAHNWSILKEWEAGHPRCECPPYDWYRHHGGALGLEPLPDWYVSHLIEFFEACRPKLTDDGSLWVNIGDTYFARWASIRDEGRQGLGSQKRSRRRTPMGGCLQEKQLLLVPARFAIGMQEKKWILRNDLIWFKPNVPPRPEKDRLRLSHEHFFHFVKRPAQGRAKYYYDISQAESRHLDVVECLVRNGTNGHTATFPRAIIEPRILSSCPKGGTVLDPFCGTGVAVECAIKNSRFGIGFEIHPEYLQHDTEESR